MNCHVKYLPLIRGYLIGGWGRFFGAPPQKKLGFFKNPPPPPRVFGGPPAPPPPPLWKFDLKKNEIFVWKNPFLGVFNLYFSQNFGRPPLPKTPPYSRFWAPPYSENPKITPASLGGQSVNLPPLDPSRLDVLNGQPLFMLYFRGSGGSNHIRIWS